MNIKLVAADMDGTLLRADKTMSPYTVEVFKKAYDVGITLWLSSGRSWRGLSRYYDNFDYNMPLITFNGAEVVHSRSHDVLYASTLDNALAAEVFELGVKQGAIVACWESDHIYLSADNAATEEYCAMSGAPSTFIEDSVKLQACTLRKALWICPDAQTANEWRLQYSEQYKGRLNISTSSPTLLEFVDCEVSKGVALRRLCDKLGIDMSETISFGDGYNDAEMLAAAGRGVAMLNANDEVKALANDVTEYTNEQDGVARYIEKLIKVQK